MRIMDVFFERRKRIRQIRRGKVVRLDDSYPLPREVMSLR